MTSPTQITVQATIVATIDHVWDCWTTPEHIMQWNAASADWHTTQSSVDLRVVGLFRRVWKPKTAVLASISGAPIPPSSLPPHWRIRSVTIARSASNLWPMVPKLPSLSNSKPNKRTPSICKNQVGNQFWTILRPMRSAHTPANRHQPTLMRQPVHRLTPTSRSV